jgi:hypothetical protein
MQCSAFKGVVQICFTLFAKSVAQAERNLHPADENETHMQTQRN